MLNSVVLQGRLGQDPEDRVTQSGTRVAKVSIAVDRGKDRGTDWIDITAFGTTAELMLKWFHKGDEIIVDGRLEVSQYTDRSGTKRKSVGVTCEKIYFCGTRNAGQTQQKDDGFTPIDDDSEDAELPF